VMRFVICVFYTHAHTHTHTIYTGEYIQSTYDKMSVFPRQMAYLDVTEDNRYQYFHIPLLLSANSATIYRGS
jgi:5-hydroxyisourate hydrolase-like protein (transthyretin family)